MSWFPLIYISSDDSSDEAISYYSDSEENSTGWSGYFPPTTTSAPSVDVDSEKDDPTFNLSEELPKALTTALKTAISNMKWPESSKSAKDLKPPPQVLGLACPRKQLSFDEKRNKPAKSKHTYEGKGKKPM